MELLSFTLAFAGFAALCLSMERHAKQVIGAVLLPPRRRLAAAAGWGLLALSLAPALQRYGVSVGITAWLGFLGFAAVAVGLLLSYAPRQIRYLAPAALVVGVNLAWLL